MTDGILSGMPYFTYFAGFVCGYSYADLLIRYVLALVLTIPVVLVIQKYGIKRIKNKIIRHMLYVILCIFTLVGWHLLYLVFIKGNFFGCPISPFFESL